HLSSLLSLHDALPTFRTFDEAITGRSLYPIRAGAFRNLAEFALEVIAAEASPAVDEIIVLEDDLHFRVTAMSFVANRFNIVLDVDRKSTRLNSSHGSI